MRRIASAEEWLPYACALPAPDVSDPAAIDRCLPPVPYSVYPGWDCDVLVAA